MNNDLGVRMIFSAYDYVHFKNRTGRYKRDVRKNLMATAWEGGIPPHVLDTLEEGDFLFFQNFGSITSWLIMYATSSHVSHVGLYVNKGKVGHAIPKEGVTVELLEKYYSENIRILPAKLNVQRLPRANVTAYIEGVENKKYGYITVFRKALKILSGRHWYYFRWKFFIDVSVLIFAIDFLQAQVNDRWFLVWILPVYFSLILFNWIYWKINPLSPDGMNGVPNDLFLLVGSTGSMIVGDAYAVRDQDHDLQVYRLRSKEDNENQSD